MLKLNVNKILKKLLNIQYKIYKTNEFKSNAEQVNEII